ncbi:hypothetical protein ASU31_19215 [Pedobacter ginsenosidimutans]|uniref:Uncharacterized protein n=1 Tax=Pedobacter ginsenosidimutans TaxID=687842 RepID=A0A0T5VL40_9SPHI|nr:hypothetical protein [Pedobacter ginsenosidimutans]KRT14425.1 hypothetical protein ASU31_19215 [Pedobacter ginsenosidimutans]
MKKIFILSLFIVGATVANAQIRDRNENQNIFIRPTKELSITSTSKHDELLKQLTSIMQPVVDKLKERMEANPETYKAYQENVKSVSSLKTMEEKQAKVAQIAKAYYSFIKKIWTEAKIDEPSYQQKIREVFPDDVKRSIQFGEFLTFQYEKAKPVAPYTPGGSTPNPTNPPVISKPVDPNPIICVDENTTATPLFDPLKSGVGSCNHYFYGSNNSAYPNTIKTVADAQGPWGSYSDAAITIDRFSIPGTFPFDSRGLKASKDYHWKASAYTISVLGCAITYYYETPFFASALKDWQTEICICAPATFMLFSNKNVDKQFVNQGHKGTGNLMGFGLGSGVIAGASGLAFAGGESSVQSKKWELCETP